MTSTPEIQPPDVLPPLDRRWRRRDDGTLIWREQPDDLTSVGVGVPPGPRQERLAQEIDWWRRSYDEHPSTKTPRDTRDQIALRMEL